MFGRYLFIAAALLIPTSAIAEVAHAATQNQLNWDIFLKLYPRRALEAKEEGMVGFTVTLDNKGEVTGCQVTHSSGHPLLDQETCKLITLNAVFTPDPALAPSQTKSHEGVINWKLPGSLKAIGPAQMAASNGLPEKTVCKKTLKTGSNASYERVCMTPTEWAKQSEQQKAEWGDLQGKKGSTSGN